MSLEQLPDLERLIHAYLDGDIVPADMDQLNACLRLDPTARSLFTEHMHLDSALAELAAELPGQRAAVEDIVELNRRALFSSSLTSYSIFSAALAIVLAVGLWWWPLNNQSYCTVVRALGVSNVSDGQVLGGHRTQFPTGMVELVTARGARLVIEAPADFYFESAQRLNLRRGRVTAEVPLSAVGFTVVAPAGDVIDLGTKFAVDVSSQTEAEVHVFEGEVSARAQGSNHRRLLTASSAVRIGSHQRTTACDVRPGAFVDNRELAAMAEALQAGQLQRAQSASRVLKRDPHLLAWLDFDTRSEGKPIEFGAEVRGARWVQGRFPGTGAIDFVDSEDCVVLSLNSRTPRFTLMTWLRINQFEGRQNSIYSTDEWGETGQVHWLIGDHNAVRFAIKGTTLTPRGNTNVWLESQPRSLAELERWVHLALVYDADMALATQYLNGQPIAAAAMPPGLAASLGPAQLGNWKPQAEKEKDPRRRLSGRMDEFAAFSRALAADEIREYYMASTPYK